METTRLAFPSNWFFLKSRPTRSRIRRACIFRWSRRPRPTMKRGCCSKSWACRWRTNNKKIWSPGDVALPDATSGELRDDSERKVYGQQGKDRESKPQTEVQLPARKAVPVVRP